MQQPLQAASEAIDRFLQPTNLLQFAVIASGALLGWWIAGKVRPRLASTDAPDDVAGRAREAAWVAAPYAIILLRQEGYPCIFHPDYYGASYSDKGRDGNTYSIELASHRKIIDILLQARRHVCYGPQIDYFDHFNTIGWTRHGSSDHPHAMAVLLSDSEAGSKWMDVARPHTRFRDLTGQIPETVTSNADGWAEFRCGGGSVSVWVEEAGIAAINAAGA